MSSKGIKAPSSVKAPIFADFWMTVQKGEIKMFGSGFPPQELTEDQIALSKDDYWKLKRLWNKNSIEDFHLKLSKLKWFQSLLTIKAP